MKPLFPALWLLVMLLCGFVSALRLAGDWRERENGPEGELDRFLTECRSRIPENETVYLTTDAVPYKIATRLYPRPVRICPEGEIAQLPSRDPDSWFIRCPKEFDRAAAVVLRTRDLR